MDVTIARYENVTMTRHALGCNTEIFCLGKPVNYHWCPNGRINFSGIIALARQHNVQKVFVPSLRNMTGRMAQQQDFLQGYEPLGTPQVSVHHGVNADGMNVPKDASIFFASADCPTTVVVTPERVMALHCARDSLLDRGLIGKGMPSREHVSIIDAALADVSRNELAHAEVYICCGTGPFEHSARHPQFGEYNQKLADFLDNRDWGAAMDVNGRLNLSSLIKLQLRDRGIPLSVTKEDGVDTHRDHHWWWSNRHGDKGRNGVFVIHR